MQFSIEKCSMLIMKAANDTLRTEGNYKIKTKLELSEKRKPTNTWEYLKLTLSNKWR